MKKKHKIASAAILLLVVLIAFFSKAPMTNATAQNLVTFFSVVFGFYMTSIAILYNASYTKLLHAQIDEKTHKRGTHVLKSYLLINGYWSIFSIVSIILFTICSTEHAGGVLRIDIAPFVLPVLYKTLEVNLLFSSGLFGIAILNIFYMLLLMHTIIDGIIDEARK